MEEQKICANPRCGKVVEAVEGKRPKLYCSDACRSSMWSKNNPKRDSKKWVKMSTFQELKDKNDALLEELQHFKMITGTESTYLIKTKQPSLADNPKDEVLPQKEKEVEILSYNEYLSVIPKITSIEECKRLSSVIVSSDFAQWQKVELEKRIKARSQHEDLN